MARERRSRKLHEEPSQAQFMIDLSCLQIFSCDISSSVTLSSKIGLHMFVHVERAEMAL
jgi:hypothetical protein